MNAMAKIWYQSKHEWCNEDWRKIFDTPECRRYAGRRMARLINRSKIRAIMDAAHHVENFK